MSDESKESNVVWKVHAHNGLDHESKTVKEGIAVTVNAKSEGEALDIARLLVRRAEYSCYDIDATCSASTLLSKQEKMVEIVTRMMEGIAKKKPWYYFGFGT